MLFTTSSQYHLFCPACGRDWWNIEGFSKYCPYCNSNIAPTEIVCETTVFEIQEDKEDNNERN